MCSIRACKLSRLHRNKKVSNMAICPKCCGCNEDRALTFLVEKLNGWRSRNFLASSYEMKPFLSTSNDLKAARSSFLLQQKYHHRLLVRYFKIPPWTEMLSLITTWMCIIRGKQSVEAKFHYASWFGAGSKLVQSWFERWNLAYHLAC